jgi:hypothetical protein
MIVLGVPSTFTALTNRSKRRLIGSFTTSALEAPSPPVRATEPGRRRPSAARLPLLKLDKRLSAAKGSVNGVSAPKEIAVDGRELMSVFTEGLTIDGLRAVGRGI